jgi:AmmeMemoRadiSam system protein B/AmmeMemoRadiSam system protein A
VELNVMMRQKSIFIAMIVAFLLAASVAGTSQEKVRQAGVAGAFYPANPDELSKMVDGFLAKAQVPSIHEPLIALIAPHAGYPFSGAVAGHSYAVLKNRKFHRVVIIAPSHYEAFPFSAVYDGDAYVTPLGRIPVDKAFAAALAAQSSSIRLSSRGHERSGEQAEHSLEVQLPFLQRTLQQFQLVPIIMGDQSYEASRALGVALAKLIHDSDTLIVASSDLSHYHPYDEASTIDHNTLHAIEAWDYFNLSRNLQARVWEACGGGPIVATMIAAERLGATRAELLKYANSGDVTGDRSRVVGYSAFALYKAASTSSAARPFTLTPKEKQELLSVARKSVETAVRERKSYEPPTGSPALQQDRGAFVTITKNGELRGCIGYVSPVQPLLETVRDVAALAALRDPRFPPVTLAELGELQYEVSVLSPFRRVLDVREIHVGQHGLLMKKGDHEGVLLPQVPVEAGWDRKTFLEGTARKAGLPPSAWKDDDTDIFLFSALVFNEGKSPASITPEVSSPVKRP